MWLGHPDLYMDKKEEILITPFDNDIGYFIEVDLSYPVNIKENTKQFPFCPGKKKNNPDKHNDYMKKMKPENSSISKKIDM